MIWVVVNKESGGLARYPRQTASWTQPHAESEAVEANHAAEELGIKTRYEAREVEEWRK